MNPKAKSFFELKSSTGFVMRFPQPGYIEGVKSKGKPRMKMAKCTYAYPVNPAPTVKDVTVHACRCRSRRASRASAPTASASRR